jgi:hypothetical protein
MIVPGVSVAPPELSNLCLGLEEVGFCGSESADDAAVIGSSYVPVCSVVIESTILPALG